MGAATRNAWTEAVDSGKIRTKAEPRPGSIKPAPKDLPPLILPAPKPPIEPIESEAEKARVAAILEDQKKDFANPEPRPGSAAAGIVNRTKQKIPGVMNQTEASYASILEGLKKAGEILDYLYEEHKLKVGITSWYCPDFFVTLPDGRAYLVEVKAFRDDKETGEMIKIINEDSAEKIKACLLRHPYPILIAFGRSLGRGKGHEFRSEWAGKIEP